MLKRYYLPYALETLPSVCSGDITFRILRWGQNRDIKLGNRSFENLSQLKYLGTTVTNQNLIHEKIKRRLNSGNACYHLVQNFLSSCLLPKSVKIRIYTNIILPVVLYGCETWSLTLKVEHRQRVFANRALARVFGRKRDNMTGGWRKLHNEGLHDLYSSPSIIRIIKSRRRMRWAEYEARVGEEMNAYRLLVGRPEGRRPLGGPNRRLRG
jgi:hypothetical protein